MSKKVRILSIDGGGIRGIIPATVLNYVEQQLQKLSGKPQARLADYFDFMAGTSTGGILSCFYLMPTPSPTPDGPSTKFSAQQALDFYVQEGFKIFNQSKKKSWFGLRQLFNATGYSPKALEQIFEANFGNVKLSELKRHCLVTTYDMEATSPFFFDSRETKERDFYVKDVTRSTSAAPTFFPPAQIKNLKSGKPQNMVNIDGGVFANDPTMIAYVECRKTTFPDIVDHPTAKDMLILSLGAGGGQFKMNKVTKSSKWWVGKWAVYIPNIMMDGATDTVTTQMTWLFDTLGDQANNYMRVDVPQPPYKKGYSSDMADASPKNIEDLKKAGEDALQLAIKNGLDEFIQKLMDE